MDISTQMNEHTDEQMETCLPKTPMQTQLQQENLLNKLCIWTYVTSANELTYLL